MRVLLLFFAMCTLLFAQTEDHRWEKTSPYYKFVKGERHVHKSNSGVMGFLFLVYQHGFSDHDGDNCPFHPSCSAFFVESVQRTNLLKGMLMFSDRFTRDSNLFKSAAQYGYDNTGKLYDPVENYMLFNKKIKVHIEEN